MGDIDKKKIEVLELRLALSAAEITCRRQQAMIDTLREMLQKRTEEHTEVLRHLEDFISQLDELCGIK